MLERYTLERSPQPRERAPRFQEGVGIATNAANASPPPGRLQAWLPLLLAPVVMLAAVLALQALVGGFGQLTGSTEAWLMAHVARVMMVGDYAAATGISMIPNTTWNCSYPALVAGLAGLSGAHPTAVGQTISAAAFGLAMLALARCWWSAGGLESAVAGGLALLFPTAVLTATMARYDAMAICLVLCAGWATIHALEGDRLWAWALAGLAAGLTFNTREFMLAPALGGIGVGGLVLGWSCWRGESRRVWRPFAALGSVLLGLLLGLVPLPLALGLSPLSGLDAWRSYSLHNQFGHPTPVTELLYLDMIGPALALGAGGLVLALLRPGRPGGRRAAWVLLGMLAPYGLFLLSRQQSPQYYLLGHVLVLSGAAGLVGALPRRWARIGAVALLLGACLPWIARKLQPGDQPRGPDPTRLHSEAWPVEPHHPSAVIGWGLEYAASRPIVVMSGAVENIDALTRLEHDRPVAFLFREWTDRIDDAVTLYDGEDVLFLFVERREHWSVPEVAGMRIDRMESGPLIAELWVIPGRVDTRRREEPCTHGRTNIRGACLQKVWLEGGDDAVRERILAQRDHYRELQGWRAMWW